MDFVGIKELIALTQQQSENVRQIGEENLRQAQLQSKVRIRDELIRDMKSFSFFDKVFNRKQYLITKTLQKERISGLDVEIAQLESTAKDENVLKQQGDLIRQSISETQQRYGLSNDILDNIQMFSINEDGCLVIDMSKVSHQSLKNIMHNPSGIISSHTDLPDDKIVMVHKTSYFPETGKILTNRDGHKTFEEYASVINGFYAKGSSCRETSHYTLNCVVKSHGYGNWEGDCICVLDEFSEHKDEFSTVCAGDSYTRGSVVLSDKSLIVVSPQIYQTLTPEQRKQGNIVVSVSQTTREFDNSINVLLAANNRPFIKGDFQNAGHANSKDIKYEKVWEKGSLIFNFLKSKHNIFEENLTLSGEELDRFAYITSRTLNSYTSWQQNGVYKIIDDSGKEIDISGTLVSTFLCGGLRKNEDGSYTRVEDYKALMEELENLESLEKESYLGAIQTFIKQNGLIEMQRRVNAIQEHFDAQPTPTIEEVLQMPLSQIGTFENLKALQVANEYIQANITNENRSIFICPEGVLGRAAYSSEIQNNLDYIPNDNIVSVNESEFVVPSIKVEQEENGLLSERQLTLQEGLDIAQQVKIVAPEQSSGMEES